MLMWFFLVPFPCFFSLPYPTCCHILPLRHIAMVEKLCPGYRIYLVEPGRLYREYKERLRWSRNCFGAKRLRVANRPGWFLWKTVEYNVGNEVIWVFISPTIFFFFLLLLFPSHLALQPRRQFLCSIIECISFGSYLFQGFKQWRMYQFLESFVFWTCLETKDGMGGKLYSLNSHNNFRSGRKIVCLLRSLNDEDLHLFTCINSFKSITTYEISWNYFYLHFCNETTKSQTIKYQNVTLCCVTHS